MKAVAVLSVILVAIAMASADKDANLDARSASLEAAGTSAIPQPATNPANVIFRIIQAPRAVASRSEQYVHQHAAQPVTFFTQPAVTRVVQQAVQPVITRTVVQQPSVQRVTVAKAAEPEPIDSNPSYNFGYEINAAESTVHTGHKESRNNGEVTGEYRVLDPNGNLRITRYTAGPNGYNAEVEIQEGVGPVYQHVVRKEVETRPVAAAATKPVITFQQAPVASSPVAATSDESSSAEKRESLVDANVLNLNRGTFFQSAAPVAAAPAAAGIQYAYIAVPQSQAAQFLSSGSHQQVLANPYSYIRSVPSYAPVPITVRQEYTAQQVPVPTAFSAGTTFTRIVRGDGIPIEY